MKNYSYKQRIVIMLRKLGYDLSRYRVGTSLLARRKKLMEHEGVDLLLDVGANDGGYASEVRVLGYEGEIISFEPIQKVYKELIKVSEKDDKWQAQAIALGSVVGEQTINISGNLTSSSLLPILDSHTSVEPSSEVVDQELISVDTLDNFFSSRVLSNNKVWLKIDTQGYEESVIDGALESLKHIRIVQMELSLSPLYAGEASYRMMLDKMDRLGFDLVGIEPGFNDSVKGVLLAADFIFKNRS